MRALDPEVQEAVWQAVEPLVPRPVVTHPLGCHRRRKSDRDCFQTLILQPGHRTGQIAAFPSATTASSTRTVTIPPTGEQSLHACGAGPRVASRFWAGLRPGLVEVRAGLGPQAKRGSRRRRSSAAMNASA